MIHVIGRYFKSENNVEMLFLLAGDFYFTLSRAVFVRLNFKLGDITLLNPSQVEVAKRMPDVTNSRRFISMLKGTTGNGNSNDLVLSSKAVYNAVRSTVNRVHGKDIDQLNFSAQNFADIIALACRLVKSNTGKTLVEVDSYLLRTYDNPDIRFIKQLVKGTVFSKDIHSALVVLKTDGVVGLLEQHYVSFFSKDGSSSVMERVLRRFTRV